MRTVRLLAALAWAALLPLSVALAVDPGSRLVGCDQADQQLTLAASAHLDPSCTWTRGVEIVASDVVLDCQGAHIVATGGGIGIHVVAPTDVSLSNVVVRNCWVEGFLNDVRIERAGFHDLIAGEEYEHAFSNILVEDSTFMNSRGVGVYVDGFVTGVTLRNLHVEGAGSAGIYLEEGSRDNVVDGNTIVNNGYRENGPNGQFFDLGGLTVFFWGVGREGLAIDGSRNNRVTGNTFSGNSAGAIFLYKNCGEFVHQHPERYFVRRYGADGNLIEGNTIVGERNGVWVAARMGENTLPMDCSDPAYVSDPLTRVALDVARDAVVRGNTFTGVTYGVRVEDDRAVVEDNVFIDVDPAHVAIVVGTRFRTPVLGLPVDGTTIVGNHATIAGNTNPYRWIHGHTHTTFTDNESHGRVVGFCEGVQPATTPFIFTIAFTVADPANPPTGPGPTLPPPDPLAPCPLACAGGGGLAQPKLVIRRLDTPAGDDTIVFTGTLALPVPFAPPLDPATVGIGVRVRDAAGTSMLDLLVPGGAYDALTRVGWKTTPSRGSWKWVDRSAAPLGGLGGITVKDLSRRSPGLVRVSIRGRHGAYAIDPTALPLTGTIILDPPTAETGQCAAEDFAGPVPSCTSDGRMVRCR